MSSITTGERRSPTGTSRSSQPPRVRPSRCLAARLTHVPAADRARDPIRVLVLAGARPNFVKVAPIVAALREDGHGAILVHTGQHYDHQMSAAFLWPDYLVGMGAAPGDSRAIADAARRPAPASTHARDVRDVLETTGKRCAYC